MHNQCFIYCVFLQKSKNNKIMLENNETLI
nr:MAG TPA: hypothetical protein [Caudoviricetes sp.]